MNVDNTEVITVLSLCTGYGGIELGMARALANPMRVVAVEVEAFALANLVAKIEESKLAIEAMWPDLRTFPAERFRGCFDFITAGYPCQPFSFAGKRQGTDDPRHLWPDIARIIEAIEPIWFFGENVPGHLSLGFPDVYCSLRDMGYKVEAGLFSAAECGAPHRRQRLFILAYYNEQGLEGQKRRQSQLEPSGKLADDSDGGCQGRKMQQAGKSALEPSGKLADAASQRIQRPEPARIALAERQIEQCRWPARPGQPQYEWEEPRTIVGNAGGRRRKRSNAELQTRRNPVNKTGKTLEQQKILSSDVKTESQLGRAIDGTAGRVDAVANRVDRLRLLGNGVVPQQAEKAFRELIKKMNYGLILLDTRQ